jgi:hypothetical protein
MPYSDCPQAEELTQCLIAAYTKMTDEEVQRCGVVDEIHNAIMDHKSSCPRCRKVGTQSTYLYSGTQRVA